jgi:hypothetical protein
MDYEVVVSIQGLAFGDWRIALRVFSFWLWV